MFKNLDEIMSFRESSKDPPVNELYCGNLPSRYKIQK